MNKYTRTYETWTDPNGATWPVKIKRYEERPKLVTFGRRGHTVHFSNNHRLEGYDDPESLLAPSRWWTHDFATRLDPKQWEGVPFVDTRAAVDTDAGFRMVLQGPMVNVDIADGEVDVCPTPSAILALGVAENSFGTLLRLQAAHRETQEGPGPLDSVSTAEFCRRWKEAGATVGVIRNGKFVAE